MRKRLITTLALGAVLALAAAGIATAEKPTIVQAGNLKLTLNGSFSPKKLPKSGKAAPITLNVSGKIETTDGTHAPALKEVVVETDKNGSIDVKGLPTCTSGKLQAQDTSHAEAICRKAIIGSGITNVEVEFPESNPFIAKSKLLAFNGGTSGGKTTIFIHAYLTSPVSAAVVTTVKISKIHNGRYGTKSVASVPKIAGGYGSVKEFALTFDRGYKNTPFLFAKCPDGHLNAKATSVFADGTRLTGTFVRSCTPKG
ncbi:MAG: hypothetical protein QOF13_87 [Solirubrobacterales bacterium]|jgi:hypothetical protein|nr:hypothetical protein [Solirubrobacterales bacterium]